MPNKQKISTQKTAVKKPEYIRAVGRRKTSVARVRLYATTGESTVNGMPINDYFPGEVSRMLYESPFKTSGQHGKFYITAKVEGGGVNGQLQAVAHGTSRALVKYDESLKPSLKKKDLLKRDPRMKERRKAGFAQKARARKQSPKR